jgi:hypothetical protein
MKIFKSLMPLAVVSLLCLWMVQAEAASIPGLFNTGIDNSNALLPDGATDPHYTLITSADPSFPGPAAMVVNSSGYPIPPWIADGPNSKWIALSANENLANTSGLYIYQTTFNLSGLNPSSAVITGQWTTDNNGANILINGISTGFTTPLVAFSSGFFPFTINSGFVAGLNTLDFEVVNAPGTIPNPTGLRVELSGTANVTGVAEPITLLLLGSGLIGLVALRKRLKI